MRSVSTFRVTGQCPSVSSDAGHNTTPDRQKPRQDGADQSGCARITGVRSRTLVASALAVVVMLMRVRVIVAFGQRNLSHSPANAIG